jgi:hypothetical protein
MVSDAILSRRSARKPVVHAAYFVAHVGTAGNLAELSILLNNYGPVAESAGRSAFILSTLKLCRLGAAEIITASSKFQMTTLSSPGMTVRVTDAISFDVRAEPPS